MRLLATLNAEVTTSIIHDKVANSLYYRENFEEVQIPELLPSYSPRLFRDNYKARVLKCLNEQKYQSAINDCDTAIEVMGSRFPLYTVWISQFRGRKIQALILISRLGKAISEIEMIKMSELMPTNRYNYIELKIRLSLKLGDFDTAYIDYIQNFNSSDFKEIPELKRELWALYGLYFDLLNKYVPIRGYQKLSKKAITNKFRTLRKDRDGMYIPLLVVDLLNNKENIFFKYETIKSYKSKYLRKENHRTQLFLDILIKSFAKRKPNINAVVKLFKELCQVPISISPTVEFIPYDLLLEITAPEILTR